MSSDLIPNDGKFPPNMSVAAMEVKNYCSRPIQQIAQSVRLSDFDFDNNSFRVYTELTLIVYDIELESFYIDIGKGCKLPNEVIDFDGTVTLDNVSVYYERNSVTQTEFPENEPKSLEKYRRLIENDYSNRPYSLKIHIPHEVQLKLREMSDDGSFEARQFVLKLECLASNPKGINFVKIPDKSDSGINLNHCYTYRTESDSSTFEWLPCIDRYYNYLLFEMEIEVPKGMSALATGEHIETDEELEFSLFRFRHLVPTLPFNIGFAIGYFEYYVHPDVPEVVFHCLPGSLSCLKHTVAQCGRVFEFFEELLSSRFPFPCYHMLFAYNSPDDFISYSGFSILAADLLYHKRIIDKVHPTRKAIVNAIASQFFGCFIQPRRFNDLWLIKSLARFITFLYVERVFGVCEYVYEMYTIMKEVCDYENRFGKLCLYPRTPEDIADCFSNPTCPVVASPKQADMAVLKGFLVMKMLHDKLGREPFMKVLHNLVFLATRFGNHNMGHVFWFQLGLGVDSFFQTVSNVTGREVPTLMDQWVFRGGHPHFEVKYGLNKKRNVIELDIKQELKRGRQLYTGPLVIVVQELDGSYTHTVQIDKELVRDEVPCHSKGRNKKKKKVLLSMGDEVDMDFSKLDQDATVLWLRVDPEMSLIREIMLDQPLVHYEYMVLYERNIPAQLFALDVLKNLNTVQTIDVLNEVILNENWFYQVRAHAMRALANTRTKFAANVTSNRGMVEIFQEYYGSKSAPDIVASNNVVVLPMSLQMYLLQQQFVRALAMQRDQRSRCPQGVVNCILALLYFNDNSQNRFADDYLVASYLQALARTLTISDNHSPELTEMDPTIARIIAEMTRTLNIEMMKPSHGRVVQIACLLLLCDLQKFGHIPIDLSMFWMFADAKCNYVETRITAIQCIARLIKSQNKTRWFAHEMPKIVRFILDDEDPRFTYKALSKVAENPPFHYLGESGARAKQLPVNSQTLFNLLWEKMQDADLPQRVRLLLMDLFFVFYGSQTPEVYSEESR